MNSLEVSIDYDEHKISATLHETGTVTIFMDNIWSGTGTWDDETAQIVDCSAQFFDEQDKNDEIYDMLDMEIACEIFACEIDCTNG